MIDSSMFNSKQKKIEKKNPNSTMRSITENIPLFSLPYSLIDSDVPSTHSSCKAKKRYENYTKISFNTISEALRI